MYGGASNNWTTFVHYQGPNLNKLYPGIGIKDFFKGLSNLYRSNKTLDEISESELFRGAKNFKQNKKSSEKNNVLKKKNEIIIKKHKVPKKKHVIADIIIPENEIELDEESNKKSDEIILPYNKTIDLGIENPSEKIEKNKYPSGLNLRIINNVNPNFCGQQPQYIPPNISLIPQSSTTTVPTNISQLPIKQPNIPPPKKEQELNAPPPPPIPPKKEQELNSPPPPPIPPITGKKTQKEIKEEESSIKNAGARIGFQVAEIARNRVLNNLNKFISDKERDIQDLLDGKYTDKTYDGSKVTPISITYLIEQLKNSILEANARIKEITGSGYYGGYYNYYDLHNYY